jgi:tetratricopeptide (TPR) repeat protein
VTADLRGAQLRRAVAGLLSFAAAEEQALLAAVGFGPGSGGGSPGHWAAVPLVAHNNQFKDQQAERIRCLLDHRVPPAYGEIDHSSEQVYQGYLAQPPDAVLAACRETSARLIDGTWALSDEDLLDPARHSWLNGRLLWLQIVVRGFWHPTGYLGDYYLARDQAGQAVAIQAQGLAMARYLGAPAAAAGMAGYNLACAQARAGQPDQAARTLAEAIEANPDLRANARRDPDLEVLREARP